MRTREPRPQRQKRPWSQVLGITLAIVVGLYALRWGYTEYWISQHCTMVLGTRVCQ